jgi:hypothetical protein
LVQRLLLLEAVQQPTAWSFLTPQLCGIWQQQQQLDLARVACNNNNSSSSSMDVARRTCDGSGWLPPLPAALLQPLMLPNAPQDQIEAACKVADVIWPQPGQYAAEAAAQDAAVIAQQPRSVSSYMLGCLSDAACRASLACWVLMWHGCMLQQGGDYGSVQSRCVASCYQQLQLLSIMA